MGILKWDNINPVLSLRFNLMMSSFKYFNRAFKSEFEYCNEHGVLWRPENDVFSCTKARGRHLIPRQLKTQVKW